LPKETYDSKRPSSYPGFPLQPVRRERVKITARKGEKV
jgi:hypothetical protein